MSVHDLARHQIPGTVNHWQRQEPTRRRLNAPLMGPAGTTPVLQGHGKVCFCCSKGC